MRGGRELGGEGWTAPVLPRVALAIPNNSLLD